MEINDFRMIKSDKHNWSVDKKHIIRTGPNKGDMVWIHLGFYPKPEQAALRLFDEMISTDDK